MQTQRRLNADLRRLMETQHRLTVDSMQTQRRLTQTHTD